MKKTMITALAALTFAGSAQAAGYDEYIFGDNDSGFAVIAQFGLNISNYRINELPSMNPKAGFNVGIHGEYVLPQCYGVYLNAGLDYSMKGAKQRFELLGATAVTRPMYLSLPIHVGYRYNVMEDLGVYADFGPYFAFGTNGKHILQKDDFSDDIKYNVFMTEDNPTFYTLQRTDFGLGFRLGAEYAGHYNFIFSCDWGITDVLTQEQKHLLVSNPPLPPTYVNPQMKNFAAGLTFGYRF